MGHIPFTPTFVVDTSDHFAKKMEAVKAYRSQLHDPESREPLTGIARPDFLLRIEARDRHFGSLIERVYGEPFRMKRALPVDDPVALFTPFEYSLSSVSRVLEDIGWTVFPSNSVMHLSDEGGVTSSRRLRNS